MFNLIDHNTGYKIDFILRKNTQYAQVAFARRQKTIDFTGNIYVISLEDLILAKLMWIQDIFSDRQMAIYKIFCLKINWIAELNINT